MTRKITLSIILILLIFVCYELFFGQHEVIRQRVASISQLESLSKKLETASLELEKNSTTDFEQKKAELKEAISTYNESKQEYEEIIPQTAIDATDVILENELKDIYDVDFLWTIVGNYATEEGINLKFDINKNFTSASSINNKSSNYVVCDLKFVITGKYINLTDFIYDIEDDDRLNFEINDFSMRKNSEEGGELEVTLNVREIKVNSSNLIDAASAAPRTNKIEEDEMQTIDSTSNNTTNSTNMTNTTTNTISNDVN